MSIILIENRGSNLGYVNKVLTSLGIEETKQDNNQNAAVIIDKDSEKVLGIIGFNSDSGCDHYNDNVVVHHEILYLEDFTRLSSNKNYRAKIQELVSDWILNYLIRQAVSASEPLGMPNKNQHFQIGINRLADKDTILERAYEQKKHALSGILLPLGFNP